MMQAEINVDISGPIWEGKADRFIGEIIDEIRHEISTQTWNYLNQSTSIYKHPTGYYKSHLTVRRLIDTDLITDQDVVYGPWLEWGGRGSKFKGYQLWEKATLWAQRSADRIVHEAEGRIVSKLG